jgi:transketolase
LLVDLNEMQVEGHIDKVINMHPIVDKWASFGFRTEQIDGHEFPEILAALDRASTQNSQPTCILARTLPGKGAPSLEGILGHNMKLPTDMAGRALSELGEML